MILLKVDNHILSIVSRANRMNGWMIRNFILRETNVILKIYKTLISSHIEDWAIMLKHENWSVILKLEGIQRRVTKLIKRVKDPVTERDWRN